MENLQEFKIKLEPEEITSSDLTENELVINDIVGGTSLEQSTSLVVAQAEQDLANNDLESQPIIKQEEDLTNNNEPENILPDEQYDFQMVENKLEIHGTNIIVKKEEEETISTLGVKDEQLVAFISKEDGESYKGTKSKYHPKNNFKVLTKHCAGGSLEKLDQDFQSDNNVCESPDQISSKPKGKKKYIKQRKFECNYCNKRFTQSNILRQHKRIHTGQKPYKCSSCSKSFRTKSLFKLHTQVHTGKKHGCDLCGKRFAQIGGLKLHLAGHSGKKTIPCRRCGQGFSSTSSLLRHIRRCHDIHNTTELVLYDEAVQRQPAQRPTQPAAAGGTDQDSATCPDCGKTFKTKKLLKHHMRIPLKENCSSYLPPEKSTQFSAYKCAHCGNSYKSKTLLRRHIETNHSSENSKVYICNDCGKSFTTSGNFVSHYEVHHSSHVRDQYVCGVCNMGFYRHVYLRRHEKIHTGEDKKVVCEHCGLKCRSKTDLRYHVLTHFGGGEKKFECDVCGKAFSKKSKLLRHQLVHSDEQPYKCKMCDKAYKDAGSLKCHELTHFNITFTCDLCGWKSRNEYSFKRHCRRC